MTMFPNQQSLYRLIQRELPEDVYPDAGNQAQFWSTAESAAEAQVWANFYLRSSAVFDNYWPQTADLDGIAQHEITRFGDLSAGLTLQPRRDRVLAKIRSLPSLSRPDLTAIVQTELPTNTIVQIVNWGGAPGGCWLLGVSQLGLDTILGGAGAGHYPLGTDLCAVDGSGIGLTAQQWLDSRTNAYTYEVRIYEYTPSAAELAAIERVLTPAEPSMAGHLLRTNVALSEWAAPYLPAMVQP